MSKELEQALKGSSWPQVVRAAWLVAAVLTHRRRITHLDSAFRDLGLEDEKGSGTLATRLLENITREEGLELPILSDERTRYHLSQVEKLVRSKASEEWKPDSGRGGELLGALRSKALRRDPAQPGSVGQADTAQPSLPVGSPGPDPASPTFQEELFARVQSVCPPVFRAWRLRDSETDELLNEVHLSALQFLRADDPPRITNFDGFLKFRARAVLSKHMRAQRASADIRSLDSFADPEDRSSPSDPAALAELKRALDECRGKLSPVQQRVWALRHDHEKSADQIALDVGVRPGTVAVMLHRANRALWECLSWKKVLP